MERRGVAWTGRESRLWAWKRCSSEGQAVLKRAGQVCSGVLQKAPWECANESVVIASGVGEWFKMESTGRKEWGE